MIAPARALTPDERRALDRDAAVSELLDQLAGHNGLGHYHEQAVRGAIMRRLDPILALADSLVAVGVELEALDRRLDAHVRTHLGCTLARPCANLRLLRLRWRRLQDRWDRQFRTLIGGGR